MLTIDEGLCAPAHREDSTAAAALNEFAMSLLSGGHINLSLARHFQIPTAGTFVVVAVAFSASTDAATQDRDMRHSLAAECGFPVPAMLGPAYGTIMIPACSVLGSRMDDLLAVLSAAARNSITAVAVESATEAIPEAASTAHELLDLAIRLRKEPRLYLLNELALEYQITRPGPGRDYLVSMLGPVEGHPELMHTLAELVRQGFNRKRTARLLCIHPNTIDYRIRRISELTDLPMTRATHWRLFAALTAYAYVRTQPCGSGSR
ncbi:helix-turn-helix domain-containing protein [Nocardia fluminea]|uniref:PucR family transcriptional regulator n=1 Tax=Nocardia fluminea TaxID=134984 RepID=UPI0034041642